MNKRDLVEGLRKEAVMFIARRKVLASAIVCFTAVSGYYQPAEAEPLRLDCIPSPGVMGAGSAGWSVLIDYSTNTLVWFGILKADGSLDYALSTSTPAEITETTINWHRPVRWQGHVTDQIVSINRSTGVLYFPQVTGGVLTGQCEIYKGPGPKKF